MPDNECDTLFLNVSDASTVRPLRVITQYPNADVQNMDSPGRPTTLGVTDLKVVRNLDTIADESNLWTVKSSENTDLDKLLGHLGNSNSTPVTPTSFLNPRNITEDQELFADNFSRTLNKLKAEQEGWISAASTDGNDGSCVSVIQTSAITVSNLTATKTCTSGSTGYAASQSPTDSEEPLDNIPDSSNLSKALDKNPSKLTDISSPRLTSDPLVQSPNIGRNNVVRSPRAGPMQSSVSPASSAVLSSEPISTWSDSQQLASIRDCVSASEKAPRSSGLPTILSIATSLKEARAERRVFSTSNNDHPSGVSYSGPVQQRTALSPFPSSLTQPLVSDQAPVLVRYTCSDPRSPSMQSNGPCNEGLLTPLVSVPSGVHLPSTSVEALTSFEVRGPLGELYTIIRPEQCAGAVSSVAPVSVLQPNTVATNALGVLSTSLMGECSPLVAPKNPLTLLVGAAAATDPYLSTPSEKDSNRGLHISTSSGSSIIHPGTTMSLVQDMTTGALLLSPETQFQQLSSALCPGLNGKLALNTSGSNSGLMGGVTSFVLQPNSELNVASLNLISSLPSNASTDASFLTTQHPGTIRPNILLQNGCGQLTSPPNECKQNLASNDHHSLSGNSSAPSHVTSMAQQTYYSVTSVPSPQAPSQNTRKTKRSSSSTHRNQNELDFMSSSTESNSLAVMCADSSTDSFQNTSIGTKTCSKRSRTSNGSFARQTLDQPLHPVVSAPYVDPLVYVSEPHRTVLVKPEPLSSDFLDTISNHSEAFSAGTGQPPHGNTPPSSLDGLEQSHLKLERKRARNRVAARRCRERKISLIRSLENQVAERDAQVKQLEEIVARYRSEGERLRVHMEILASSYPNLKADLCQFPFLFQPRSIPNTESAKATNARSPNALHVDLSDFVSSKHFS